MADNAVSLEVTRVEDVFGRTIERAMDLEQYAYIESTDSKGSVSFIPLMDATDYSVVDSYEVYSGINYPFEYITFTMTTKTLETRAPNILDKDTGKLNIRVGKSRLIFHGRVGGIYTITKISSSNGKFTLTAYTQFETIRSKVYTGSNIEGITISDAFDLILADAGIDTSVIEGNVYQDGKLKSVSSNGIDIADNEGRTHTMTIYKNTYLWRLLQICAIYMGWKIWFTGSHMYIVNYPRLQSPCDVSNDTSGADTITDAYGVTVIPEICLHRKSSADNPTVDSVWGYCTTTLDSPSDSSESQRDTITIQYGSDNETVSWSVNDDEPPTDDAHTITVNEIRDRETAELFCKGVIKYTSDPSSVVQFTLNESIKGTLEIVRHDSILSRHSLGAERNLVEPVRIRHIYSKSSDIHYWNDGDPLKLILTSVKMTYPGKLTTYTLGENKVISLDSTLSVIRNAK